MCVCVWVCVCVCVCVCVLDTHFPLPETPITTSKLIVAVVSVVVVVVGGGGGAKMGVNKWICSKAHRSQTTTTRATTARQAPNWPYCVNFKACHHLLVVVVCCEEGKRTNCE